MFVIHRISIIIAAHISYSQENFQPLLDLFQKDSVKHDVCKCILKNYKTFTANDEANSVISDPVVINALMCVSKVLSDGVK
jgi:hypothetical protein